MSDDFLNLLDFGTNDKGEYVNLVEEEKKLKDISEQELYNWVEKNNDPLIKIAFDCYISSTDIEFGNHNDIKEKLQKIANSKCYHYGNLEKGLYIFSINNEGRHMIVFENDKHYLVNEPNCWKLSNDSYGTMVDIDFDDYLLGKETLSFPALYCPVYDLKGNRIHQYTQGVGKDYQDDIRHIACIKEWKMNKYSRNRIYDQNKMIKDFYECEFTLPDLINYWGESEISDGRND